MKKILFIVLLGLFSLNVSAQEELTRILFILDASNSMNTQWDGQTRLVSAKEILSRLVDSLKGTPNLEIALRVYGHQSPVTATYQDCNDTKLEVPFSSDNYDKIKYRIKSIEAKGTTPIARSLEAAAGDFPDNTSRNVIILITDGIEACDNDPCVIAKKLKDKGVKVTPFVIGLGLDLSYLEKFSCIGEYSSAESKAEFASILKNVVNKSVVNTTVQINLNDLSKHPKETDVTMFLYQAGTNKLIYTFVHTLNKSGNPDTLIMDPSLKYDLVVNTIPKVEVKNISLQRNTHNVIIADTPQGFIKTRFTNATRNYPVEVRVMQHDHPATINVQNVNSKDKYLVGKYDLEILTLPRITKTIDVTQSSTTTIDIPAPGFFNISCSKAMVAQLFLINDNGTIDWVCNLLNDSQNQLLQLQPGNYKVVYRQKDLKSTDFTYEKTFRILSNKSTSINL